MPESIWPCTKHLRKNIIQNKCLCTTLTDFYDSSSLEPVTRTRNSYFNLLMLYFGHINILIILHFLTTYIAFKKPKILTINSWPKNTNYQRWLNNMTDDTSKKLKFFFFWLYQVNITEKYQELLNYLLLITNIFYYPSVLNNKEKLKISKSKLAWNLKTNHPVKQRPSLTVLIFRQKTKAGCFSCPLVLFLFGSTFEGFLFVERLNESEGMVMGDLANCLFFRGTLFDKNNMFLWLREKEEVASKLIQISKLKLFYLVFFSIIFLVTFIILKHTLILIAYILAHTRIN